MTNSAINVAQLQTQIGQQVGVSGWHRIDQAMIDAFADLTQDHQFIHKDPVRAATTPFGGTVAHGFLTLSLLSVMAEQALPPLAELRLSINYGFDRVRFIAPVPAGSDVQGHLRLQAIDTDTPGQVRLTWDVQVMIRGQEIPALAAQWIHLHLIDEAEGEAEKYRRKPNGWST
jgi:acyl dehydratase